MSPLSRLRAQIEALPCAPPRKVVGLLIFARDTPRPRTPHKQKRTLQLARLQSQK